MHEITWLWISNALSNTPSQVGAYIPNASSFVTYIYETIGPQRDLVKIFESWLLKFTKKAMISPKNLFRNKIIVNFYMFGPLMKNRIGGNVQCCSIVTIEFHRTDLTSRCFNQRSSHVVRAIAQYLAFVLKSCIHIQLCPFPRD